MRIIGLRMGDALVLDASAGSERVRPWLQANRNAVESVCGRSCAADRPQRKKSAPERASHWPERWLPAILDEEVMMPAAGKRQS